MGKKHKDEPSQDSGPAPEAHVKEKGPFSRFLDKAAPIITRVMMLATPAFLIAGVFFPFLHAYYPFVIGGVVGTALLASARTQKVGRQKAEIAQAEFIAKVEKAAAPALANEKLKLQDAAEPAPTGNIKAAVREANIALQDMEPSGVHTPNARPRELAGVGIK